ncbi:MAG: hypothetical protein GY719_32645 [bacterium]|nr:hypothetical protein [bacterium]
MTQAELLTHVQASIAAAIGAELSELTPEKKIFEELGVDSVDFLDISYEIELRTGLDVAAFFEDHEPVGGLTIQGLAEAIHGRLS